MYFLVCKVIRKSVNLGTLPVFDVGTKHLVKNIPIYLSGNMREFLWKKYGKVKNLYGKCAGCFKEK